MSSGINSEYGLIIMLIFTLVVTIGFVYEIGKGALIIDSRQNILGKDEYKYIGIEDLSVSKGLLFNTTDYISVGNKQKSFYSTLSTVKFTTRVKYYNIF